MDVRSLELRMEMVNWKEVEMAEAGAAEVALVKR